MYLLLFIRVTLYNSFAFYYNSLHFNSRFNTRYITFINLAIEKIKLKQEQLFKECNLIWNA